MSTPQELVDAALAASSADGCAVLATEHSETNLRFAANKLTTNGQMQTRSLTVISIFDGPNGRSAGVVTRALTSVDEVADLVTASESIGREAEPAQDAIDLVEPYQHDDNWEAPAQRTSVTVFERFAPALGKAFDSWRTRDGLLFGFAEHMMTSYFLGTSTGLRRRFDQPDGRLELNAKSADYARSAWAGMHTRDFTDVDVERSTDDLARRLDWAQHRIELPAGRYETILPPSAVADLMIYAYWTASARDAEEGRSVYAAPDGGTRVGERLSQQPITVRSDPSEPGLQCSPFDIVTSSDGALQSVFDNGQPVSATKWISDGTLGELIRTRAWASKTSSLPRPVVDNLIMHGPEGSDAASAQDMIESTERGLLLTCLWYIREVDPQTLLLTGLTRDGVYLVEDGRVRGEVNNFRFNESPIDLLSRISQVGATEHTLSREWSDYFRRTAMPPVRIGDFNMSTVSKAL